MKTILIVDDSAESRDVYATTLSAEGFAILEAGDGAEGIRVATEERPDLIIMNVSMPLVTGLDAVEVLKSHPATEEVPVLIVTGHSTGKVRDMAWESGCDDYLSKPVSPGDLLAAVAGCLGVAKRRCD